MKWQQAPQSDPHETGRQRVNSKVYVEFPRSFGRYQPWSYKKGKDSQERTLKQELKKKKRFPLLHYLKILKMRHYLFCQEGRSPRGGRRGLGMETATGGAGFLPPWRKGSTEEKDVCRGLSARLGLGTVSQAKWSDWSETHCSAFPRL